MNHGQHASHRHHHSSIRGWLQLLRPPNLLTAPGDPLAGALLASAAAIDNSGGLALAALAGTCFYAAGTVMNDVMDARVDAQERPGRPIPSAHPVTTAEENCVHPEDPPHELRAASEPAAIESVHSQVLTAIERCRWNMTHAAAQLGISRNTLYRRIKQLGIPLPHARRS